jgi:FkbM family methyltransferase
VPAVEHIQAIKRLSPKTLIDVGTNKGQFSLVARYLFPDIAIHAFEPLEHERKILAWVVSSPLKTYATALGERDGEATFYLMSRADSSSLLKPGANQQAAFGTTLSSSITVPVARLEDSINVANLSKPILIKADVQGTEASVIKGIGSQLQYVDFVYAEGSFVQLYENQLLVTELCTYLHTRGFELRGVFNQVSTRAFGPTQADFLFCRVTSK